MSAALHDTIARQGHASDPQACVWVAANAGTGKTHVLTQRVIRLLIDGTKPERILCLTFTKAAAAEMANRLFQTLGDWATWPDDRLSQALEALIRAPVSPDRLDPARRLFAQALETPGGLKIQTIHAFCERLLNRFALEAEVPPHFDVLDDRTVEEIIARLQDRILSEAAARPETPLGQALAALVVHSDEYALKSLMGDIAKLRQRITHILHEAGGVDNAVANLAAELGVSPDSGEERLLQNAVRAPELPRADLCRAVEILAQGSTSDVKRADTIRTWLNSEDPVAEFDTYVSAFLKTGDGEAIKKLVTQKVSKRAPEVEDILRREQTRLLQVQEQRKRLAAFERTRAILILADRMITLYDDEKQARAGLDYDDLIVKSRDLLTRTTAPWVLYKLDGGLDHILIDEAQDTSPEQWQVIEALAAEFFAGRGAHEEKDGAAPRTIFAVGDEKQSIYSFQGADPDKFHEMMGRFSEHVTKARQSWRTIDLNLSFRSTREVLTVVDQVFSREDVACNLTASGQIVRHEPARPSAGLVELWPVIKAPKEDKGEAWDAPFDQLRPSSPAAILAERITSVIKTWLERGEILRSQNRPIRAGDILILLRKRGTLMDELIRALKKGGLEVAGADRINLAEQLAVMDLMAVGAFALLPDDDLTLATVLKSPFIGMSEDDLFTLAHGRTGSLWAALAAAARRSESSSSAFTEFCAKAYKALTALLHSADSTPPYDFFQGILSTPWMETGISGRQRLLERLGRDSADPVDEFLTMALDFERSHPPGLQAFLHWMTASTTDLKREHDLERDEIRIMTVHGAKGLEGNIVFLPNACDMPTARDDPKLTTTRGGNLLYFGAKKTDPELAAAIRAEIASKRLAEYHRLFYVAATRARDRLYIAGYLGGNQENVPKQSWYALAADVMQKCGTEVTLPFGETGWRLEGVQPDGHTDGDNRPRASIPAAEPPPWAAMPAPAEPAPLRLTPSRMPAPSEGAPVTNLPGGAEPPLLSPVAGDDGAQFVRGRIIHALLEHLPDLPADQRLQAARRLVERKAPHLTSAQREEIVTETLAVLSDPAFAPLFAPGSRAEVQIVASAEVLGLEGQISGQIDRLAVTESSVLVVDYKTNRPPPREPAGVSPLYLRQMAAYRAMLRALYPRHTIVCALLWTDGPRLMELPGELLDQTEAALRAIRGPLDAGGGGS